uniref:Ku domain-containing protein n=1 Tax=Saimiri boliviensis boliviensis TaxID=39432 RepID=A0A2K6U8B0_SAIBB
MSGWESYYKTVGDEGAEEQEENLEANGDYKYSGRDNKLTPFDMSIQCIRSVYISKILSSDRDLLTVMFYDTEKDKNSDNPGTKQILELDQFKGQQGQKCFQDLMGHKADYSLSEVLWVCANLFSDVQFKMSHKRITLFTNEDKPHGNDSAKASQARTKTGIFLDLMYMKKPGGFDIPLFHRYISSIAEDEHLRVHFEESSKLEDLLQKVHAKETKNRLKLKLNKDIVISVDIYNLVQKALKPHPIKLYQETNEPAKTKTQTFNSNTGSLLLPSDTKRSQILWESQIILEKEEIQELNLLDNPGLMLVGFKPLVLLKKHHYPRPSLFMYPEESLVIGSSTLFSNLLIKCLEKEVEHSPSYFVEEELDDQKIQVTPPGFQLVLLPFADVKRKMSFTEKVMATPEQVDKMKAIIPKLHFTYRSDSFENLVLQQHLKNLESLVLDLMEAEQAVNLTLPKVEAMNKRLSSLVDEFKELVYSPDYNPEGKVTKIKHNNKGSRSKNQGGVFRRGAEDPHQQGQLLKETLNMERKKLLPAITKTH